MALMADLTNKRLPKITGRLAFAKERIIAPKCRLGKNVGFSAVQVTRFFDHSRAVFEKHQLPSKKISNMDEGAITAVPSKLSKTICKKTKDSWATLCAQIAVDWSLLRVISALQALLFLQLWYYPVKRMCHEYFSKASVEFCPWYLTKDMWTDLSVQWSQHFQNCITSTESYPLVLVLYTNI